MTPKLQVPRLLTARWPHLFSWLWRLQSQMRVPADLLSGESLLCCCCSVTKSCLTLCDPMDHSPVSSVHGILGGKNTGVGCHFLLQRIFLTQGSNPHLLFGRFFTTEPPGKTLWVPSKVVDSGISNGKFAIFVNNCLYDTIFIVQCCDMYTFLHLISYFKSEFLLSMIS